MTDLYIIFDSEQDAQDVVAAVNTLVGYPNPATNTTTVSEVRQGGSKFYVLAPDTLPAEWFAGYTRLTRAQAEVAGVVFA